MLLQGNQKRERPIDVKLSPRRLRITPQGPQGDELAAGTWLICDFEVWVQDRRIARNGKNLEISPPGVCEGNCSRVEVIPVSSDVADEFACPVRSVIRFVVDELERNDRIRAGLKA